mgnify:CR=1 FL=1
MAVVSNAGPLIALARIDHLDLLEELYNEIVVPPAVSHEIMRDPDLPGALSLKQAPWLRVEAVNDRTAVERLRFWLDQGESGAIILAQELDATLLIDERRGRTIAAALGLQYTGTVGMLLAAKQNGHVERVMPLLDALIVAGIRLSNRLYEEARQLAGE